MSAQRASRLTSCTRNLWKRSTPGRPYQPPSHGEVRKSGCRQNRRGTHFIQDHIPTSILVRSDVGRSSVLNAAPVQTRWPRMQMTGFICCYVDWYIHQYAWSPTVESITYLTTMRIFVCAAFLRSTDMSAEAIAHRLDHSTRTVVN